MKILVIAIVTVYSRLCSRPDGYIPPATLTPGFDQCFTAQGETKQCDQAPPDRSALTQRKQT